MDIPGFRIIEELAGSHPGQMVRAISDVTGKTALIRVLARDDANSKATETFNNDYMYSIGLSSDIEQVLRPTDFKQHGEFSYIVYDNFNGVPLRGLIGKNTFDTCQNVTLALNLASALDQIHQKHIIHGNMSSHNILVDMDTLSIKVTDFRFASGDDFDTPKSRNAAKDDIQLEYISPELTGRLTANVDYRSDYYALGVILYELICGSLPFVSKDQMELIHSHIARLPKAPHTVCPSTCPQPLSDIILKFLDKKPESRYQSFVGIKHDLTLCKEKLETGEALAPFPLGQQDFSTQLSISSTLFGRQDELAELERMLANARKGEGGLAVVKGHAGTGKSRLINELVRRNSANNLFVSGKCEQYSRELPYRPFIEIVNKLVAHLLGQPDTVYADCRDRLLNELGVNSVIITDLAPNFEAVVGPQKPPRALGADETKNRFQETFSTFFSVISRMGKPLVINLCDVQWADHDTLTLLETLRKNREWTKNTLFITSYRDDEVPPHSKLGDLSTEWAAITGNTEVLVQNLKTEGVALMVAETFDVHTKEATSLAKTLFKLSKGNPFHIKQLISNLNNDGTIWADEEQQKWKWDTSHKRGKDEGLEVATLILDKLNALAEDQLSVLYHGFYLGADFTIKNLSMVMEVPQDEIIKWMTPQVNGDFLYITGNTYRFKHGYIQQALAEKIPEDLKKKIHLKIGKRQLSQLPETERERRLLAITNHLNLAEDLQTSEEELQTLVKLNSRSTAAALSSSAYQAALGYAQQAFKLLDKVDEAFERENRFAITVQTARCQYLMAHHSDAKSTIQDAFPLADTMERKSICYSIFKDIIVSQGANYSEAVNFGLQILEEQGAADVTIHSDFKELQGSLHKRIDKSLKGRSPEQLLDAPQLDDPEIVRLLGLLADLWEAAYYDANEDLMGYVILKSVALSIEHGNCSESAFGYVLYGMSLTLEEEYEAAYAYGNLAMELNKRFDDKVMLPKVTNLFCNYTSFHLKPFSHSAALYETSSTVGRENGDYLFGLWASFFTIWSHYLAGKGLSEIDSIADNLDGFIRRTHDDKVIHSYQVLRDIIGSLRGQDASNQIIAADAHDNFITYWRENNFAPGLTWHAILMGQYYCVVGEYEKAYQILNQDDLMLAPGIIMFPHSQHAFYHALSLLQLLNTEKVVETPEHSERIDSAIACIAGWADLCPDNFLYQQKLLEAEREHLRGDLWAASILFNEAIKAAEVHNLTPAIALCNELAGAFCEKNGNANLAELYVQSAINHYSAWGANLKVHRLAPKSNAALEASTPTKASSDYLSSNSEAGPSELDFTAILKFTQAISEEIDADRLLKTTMRIIIENAGADKGVLVLYEKGQGQVSLLGEFREEPKLTQINVALDMYPDLPKGIVHYVERTKEPFVLDDALNGQSQLGGRYFNANGVCSMICLPVIYKDDLKGILYLENHSTTGVFGGIGAKTLRILLAQLAISLQNADLYKSLQVELKQHMETAKDLAATENRLRLSHEYANVGTWEWDVITNDLFWSDTISPLIGHANGEIESSFENFNQAIHPDDRDAVKDAIQACFDGQEYEVEHRVVWPDGSIHWVMESGDVTRDENGNPIRMLGIAKDITQAKENEDERSHLEKLLLQAQKMEAIGQLTGGIAHDFNNMLSVILGNSHLIKKHMSKNGDTKIDRYVDQIIGSGERASSLISQMLAFSRGELIEKHPIDIIPAIKEATRMMASTIPSSIQISFVIGGDIPLIEANPVQLNQVLMNICINARDAFDGAQGCIEVGVELHKNYQGECSSCHKPVTGNYVGLSIKDNAGGIPLEIRESIFNPFFTTKEVGKGSGMGLAMVHGIVHGFEGHIIIDTDEGVGTTFRLLFPVASEQNDQPSDVNTKQIVPYSIDGVRILLVDDEPDLIEMLEEVLIEEGCKVSVNTDSRVAAELIKSQLDQFDIMITDQTMPGLAGADLVQMAKEIDPDFPIILCSGHSAHMNLEISLQMGVSKFFTKPVSHDELVQGIQEVLRFTQKTI